MNRLDAINQESKFYVGKACPQHGNVLRYTKSSHCVECAKLRKKTHPTNTERRRELERARYNSINTVERWINRPLKSARIRAKNIQLPFDLDKEYLLQIWTGKCPVFGFDLTFATNRSNPDNQASLDRILPEMGYVRGNVIFISNLANRIKNSADSNQIKQVLDWLMIAEKQGHHPCS